MTKNYAGAGQGKARRYMAELLGVLTSFVILIPFLLVLVNSFKSKRGANKLNLSLSGASWGRFIDNYVTVFKEARILTGLSNSVLVTAGGSALVLIFASMAAFIIIRRKTKFTKFINQIIIMGLTLPLAMVPIYFELSRLKMTTGNPAAVGAILVYAASMFPITFFLYIGFIKGISSEIDEAAIVDGAGPLRMFFTIIFPLLKPVTVTALMNCVMSIWNDFGISLYLLNNSKRTTAVLTTYLFSGQKSSEWNLLFADIVIVALPIIIIYFAVQKHIVSGLSDGAVKG